jgi:DNA polymerase (family 10)
VADHDNVALAERLEAFAALLDLAEASVYTARAYRRASETIRATPASVAELVRSGRVQELRGIGPGIAARLRELVDTGGIAELDELEREVRPDLVGLGRHLGIAPKRMLEIATALAVTSPDELRRAAHEGALRRVPGIGGGDYRVVVIPDCPSGDGTLAQAREQHEREPSTRRIGA